MVFRRLLAAALALALPLALFCQLASGAVPSSVGLIYFQKKNFKLGDWVLYRIKGANMEGKESINYQRVQAVLEEDYQGEPCVWVETGFGYSPDSLQWSAAQISENAFQDTMAYLRPNLYLRRIHQGYDDQGTPLVVGVGTFNPKIPLPSFDSRRPVIVASRYDTLDTPKGPIRCWYTESVRTHMNTKSNPDGTVERGVVSTIKRWLNADVVPITGIVREEESKVYKTRSWPIGKLSKDYPEQINGHDNIETVMIDFGHDARPRIANRVKDARDMRQINIEP